MRQPKTYPERKSEIRMLADIESRLESAEDVIFAHLSGFVADSAP